MNAKAMPQPAAWLTPPTLSLAAITFLILGIILALREARLADPATSARQQELEQARHTALQAGYGKERNDDYS